MKEMILVVRNKKDEEIMLTLEAHKVPVSVSVGSSSIDLDMEEIGELIQVLHTIKAQHKTFVNVQPMGAQALSGILEKNTQGTKTKVYADFPTPPKVEQKKDYVEHFKEQGKKKEIRLKVGQRYKSVNGYEWIVEREIPSDDRRYRDGYRFFCRHEKYDCISSFMPNGNLFDDGARSDHNLIELVEDVPTQKDKDENGRWILNVGDQVELSNGLRGEVTGYDKKDRLHCVSVKGFRDQWFSGDATDAATNIYNANIISIIRK